MRVNISDVHLIDVYYHDRDLTFVPNRLETFGTARKYYLTSGDGSKAFG